MDETKCLQMAEVAQADLAQAMPALEAAITALEALNKKDITEIKSYGQPPHLVRKVGFVCPFMTLYPSFLNNIICPLAAWFLLEL